RSAGLSIDERALEQRPPHASPLVAGKHEEHRQVPHASADQRRDHATYLPVLDGAKIAVRVAGQGRAGVGRHRLAGRPRRRASAPREVAARGDVHPPDLVEVLRPDLADVQLAHGRIITPARPLLTPRASVHAVRKRTALVSPKYIETRVGVPFAIVDATAKGARPRVLGRRSCRNYPNGRTEPL